MGLCGGADDSGIGSWYYGNQGIAIFNENDSIRKFQ